MFGLGIFGTIAATLATSLVGWLILYSAIRRVRKKLDPANKPTTWEYINELGGYAVIAVVLIVSSLVTFITSLLKLLF